MPVAMATKIGSLVPDVVRRPFRFVFNNTETPSQSESVQINTKTIRQLDIYADYQEENFRAKAVMLDWLKQHPADCHLVETIF